MTAAPADRAFAYFRRGEQRELILTGFRYRLRQLTNPLTGQPFQESEIAAATATLTRWYISADATDLVLLVGQARALLLADQVRPDRANSEFLTDFHGKRFNISKLPASGGSGGLSLSGNPGTPFIGSTTIPDPAANFFTDPAGLRYQVLYSDTIAPSGVGMTSGQPLEVQAIDTGTATNIIEGTKLTPGNGPVGFVGPAIVAADFTGGNPPETDAQFARRIAWRERHKQGSGNNAEIRGWLEDSSNAIDAAFVYASALQAGTILATITQKRGNVAGPAGRIPSVGTLALGRAAVTPPGSPNVPAHPSVLLVPPVSQSCDMAARLSLPKASSSGWTDLHPWPGSDVTGVPAQVTTLTSQTDFRITVGSDSIPLPVGVTVPALMVWHKTLSRLEILQVASVVLVSGSTYHVTLLNGTTSAALALGAYVSPATSKALADTLALTAEAYFDSLGPGEVTDFTTSLLSHRAARFPSPSEEFPQRAGSTFETMLDDALGSALADRDLPFVSAPLPALPTPDPSVGPNLLVAGRIGFYPL